MRLHTRLASIVGYSVTFLAAQAFAAASNVPSLPTAGHFSLTPSAGTAFTVGGDFVKSGSVTYGGAGTIGGNAVVGTLTVSAPSQDFSDVYDLPMELGLSGNYGITDSDEISLTPHWLHADGKTFTAGTVSAAGTINGVAFAGAASFNGKLSNYSEYGLEAGYRHFFDISASGFHPYLGAMLGAVHNNSVKLDLSETDGTAIAGGIPFYNSGWTWDTGLQAGFRYDVNSSVALGLETGIRYTADLSSNHSAFTGDGGTIDNVNNGGSRFEIPVSVGATIKF
jgi:hypothetical protein